MNIHHRRHRLLLTTSPVSSIQSKKLCPLARMVVDAKGKPKLSVETALNTLHDLYEKKCIADLTDLSIDNECDSMLDFLQDYFLQEYGLQKVRYRVVADMRMKRI